MPRLKGLGVKRPIPFSIRLNERERNKLERLATSHDLSMTEFARCKIFDIPPELVGGKPLRKINTPDQATNPTA